MNECIDDALSKPNRKVWYLAPYYRQVKEIAWNLFIDYLNPDFIESKNESELKFRLINGSEISLKGTDNPDSLVGVSLHLVVLDEAALMRPEVWFKIVRPMLVDTIGNAIFISTPRGLNWFFNLWQQGQSDDDFELFQFKTSDNNSVLGIEKEVENARKQAVSELDKTTFRQEYEASFEVLVGRPRFDIDTLKRMYEAAINPLRVSNDLSIYFEKDNFSKYIIGVDTSEGLITGDKSSATVLNCKDFRVEAELNGALSPDLFASRLASLGQEYNDALIVVEDNNHGLATINELKKIYKNLYYRKVKDEISDEWTEKIGWRTTARTKPILIANLDKALRSNLDIKSKDIISELMTYVIDDDGSTNASEGNHDDRVISLGCAIQGYLEIGEYEIKKPKLEPARNSPQWILNNRKETKHHSWKGVALNA